MANIDAFTLISGSDIYWNDLLTIRQPLLEDIRDVGYYQYQTYISILMVEKGRVLEALGIDEAAVRDVIDVYTLLSLDEDARRVFIDALSFFIREPVSYRNGSFYIDQIPASAKILDAVKDIIFELSYIKHEPKEEKPKFASKRAEELWYKLQKGKREFEKVKQTKADVNMELPNIISAVAAEHPGYNLTNIWGLTVYQLYDQFARINTKVQIGVYGQRWAAWGKEDFDTSVWFKNYSRKE